MCRLIKAVIESGKKLMKTTVSFFITERLKNKLLSEGKNAGEQQTIELDITDPNLIEYMNREGLKVLSIPDHVMHYDHNNTLQREGTRFSVLPDEEDLVHFFEVEKYKNAEDKRVNEIKQIINLINTKESEKLKEKKNLKNKKG